MQEGFERVELKINKVRNDIHQLDKDMDKHMEMHRELETEIAAIKKSMATRPSRPTRPRR
jgi:peptidoglycan hydrolase CwlO-like protein